VRLAVRRIDTSLPLPAYQTPGATAFDLACRESMTISPGALASIPSNLVVGVPTGYVLLVALRSSTPHRTGLVSPHGVGIIDQDYCGPDDEIGILVYNPTASPIVVRRGDRIAQGLLLPVERVEWDEEATMPGSSRGGFGSTG
jgi:dUTP pyrophosphatase